MNEIDWRSPTPQELSILATQIKPSHKVYLFSYLMVLMFMVLTYLVGDYGYTITFIVFFILTIISHITSVHFYNHMNESSFRVASCVVDDFCGWVYYGHGASSLPKVKVRLENGQIWSKAVSVDYNVYYAARGGIQIPCLLVRSGGRVRLFPRNKDFMQSGYNPVNGVKLLEGWGKASEQAQGIIVGYLRKQKPSKAMLGRFYKWFCLGLTWFLALGFILDIVETLPEGYLTFDMSYPIVGGIFYLIYRKLKANELNPKKLANRVERSGCDVVKVLVKSAYVKGTNCFVIVSDVYGHDLTEQVRAFPDAYTKYVECGSFYAILCRVKGLEFLSLIN